jgi:hypothetical protein
MIYFRFRDSIIHTQSSTRRRENLKSYLKKEVLEMMLLYYELDDRDSFSDGRRHFLFRHRVKTGSEAHAASSNG